MELFEQFLEYEKEITEYKLKTIGRLQQGLKVNPVKRTSKADIVEHVLQPVH